MGFFDSVKDFGGGRFAGEMTSEGSGARIRAGVRDIPIIGDVDLVNVHVPGFRDGGVVGEQQRRADESKAKLAALHRRRGPTQEQARAAATSPGHRHNDRPAPGRQSPARAATGGAKWGTQPNPMARVVGGANVGHNGMGAGSFYCWSCAAGITKPLN